MIKSIERKIARFLPVKLAALRNERPVLSLTFDDVPRSACQQGAAILEDAGVRGTYYVAGGLENEKSPSGLIHSKDDLLTLLANGHEIGSHGFGHIDYQSVNAEILKKDLEQAALYFEALGLDINPVNFAYPFGLTGLQSKIMCAQKFVTARGVKSGINHNWVDLAQLRSMPLYNSETDEQGVRTLLNQANQPKSWLILTGHGVMDHPDQFSCTPDLLRSTITMAQDMGFEILTVRNAIGHTMYRQG